MRLSKDKATILEKQLSYKKYIKYRGDWKTSDYIYWKRFNPYKNSYGETEYEYQIGVSFWDFSKYPQEKNSLQPIGVEYTYMFIGEGRIDLSASKNNYRINKFEKFCEKVHSVIKNEK